MQKFIHILRVMTWRAIIIVATAAILIGAVYYDFDKANAALKSADHLAGKLTDPLTGVVGFLATLLLGGVPMILAGATLLVGTLSAAISHQLLVWRVVGMMTIMPFIGKAIKLTLAELGWNDWIIQGGRIAFDAMPKAIRSRGNELGLEQFMQLLIVVTVMTIVVFVLRNSRLIHIFLHIIIGTVNWIVKWCFRKKKQTNEGSLG